MTEIFSPISLIATNMVNKICLSCTSSLLVCHQRKQTRSRKVGEKKMAPVFHTCTVHLYRYDLVGGAGRLIASLCPVNGNLVVYLG